MVSGYGNPSLRTCHRFVAATAALADGNDGSIVLSVRLVLAKANFPPLAARDDIPLATDGTDAPCWSATVAQSLWAGRCHTAT
jgi:hypothetical protein